MEKVFKSQLFVSPKNYYESHESQYGIAIANQLTSLAVQLKVIGSINLSIWSI